MKPAPFDLRFATSTEEALQILGDSGDDAKPIAGGQSLVPLLNFRMAQPDVLVDLGRVESLRYIRWDESGGLRIGAMTTMTQLFEETKVTDSHPLLHDTIRHIAHEAIRNRGTIGGSLSHMDPAAEMPAIALLLDAEMVVSSQTGVRVIPAADFALGAYTTALNPGELLTEVRIPALPSGARSSILEVAQRTGDFALTGSMCVLILDDADKVTEFRNVVFGSGAMPMRCHDIEAQAIGTSLTYDSAEMLGDSYGEAVSPLDDQHASGDFRRHLTRVTATRAIRDAAGMATR